MTKALRALAWLTVLVSPLIGDAQRSSGPPTAPSGKPPDSVLIEELTWAEVRDLIKGGTTTVIVGTAGTEQKGPHMVDGEHKFVMEYTGDKIARALGKTLVAPVVTYVPEGDPDRQVPGAISVPSPAYDAILDAAARSLKVHGFTDILFIGDSGPNQAGMEAVAAKLNEEWKGSETRVFALTDYYEASRAYYRAGLQAAYGYDEETVGSHAGISDTSQMLFIRPSGVRKELVKPFGGPQDSGVSGDPAKATAEIGKMGVEFKVNAGIAQYRLLKNPPQRGRGAGRAGWADLKPSRLSCPTRLTCLTSPTCPEFTPPSRQTARGGAAHRV